MNRYTLTLACATFFIGTSTYFVTGILDGIAADFGVSVGAAGQLVSAFAIGYALAAPLLVAFTARHERRALIGIALVIFAAANALAAVAPTFGFLLGTRVLAAVAAAVVTPVAVATGAVLTPASRRGAALAIVMGGVTIAFAAGIPLGTYIGSVFGWRWMFGLIAVASLAAAAGVRTVLPRLPSDEPGGLPGFAILGNPAVVMILLLTSLSLIVAFSVFAFIGPVLGELAGLSPAGISGVLLLFGVGAITGTYLGGTLADRFDSARAVTVCLIGMVLASLGYSAIALVEPGPVNLLLVCAVLIGSAVPGFTFMPLQQYRLVELVGDKADLAIALNASAIFMGQGLGAVLGGLAAVTGTLAYNGLAGAAVGVLAVGVSVAANRVIRRTRPLVEAA